MDKNPTKKDKRLYYREKKKKNENKQKQKLSIY